jgi:hypothetical protein
MFIFGLARGGEGRRGGKGGEEGREGGERKRELFNLTSMHHRPTTGTPPNLRRRSQREEERVEELAKTDEKEPQNDFDQLPNERT